MDPTEDRPLADSILMEMGHLCRAPPLWEVKNLAAVEAFYDPYYVVGGAGVARVPLVAMAQIVSTAGLRPRSLSCQTIHQDHYYHL